MAEYQKDKKEVQEFLSHAKDIILKGNVQINNQNDKRRNFINYVVSSGRAWIQKWKVRISL